MEKAVGTVRGNVQRSYSNHHHLRPPSEEEGMMQHPKSVGLLQLKRNAKYSLEQSEEDKFVLGDEDEKALARKKHEENKYTSDYSEDIILIRKEKTPEGV